MTDDADSVSYVFSPARGPRIAAMPVSLAGFARRLEARYTIFSAPGKEAVHGRWGLEEALKHVAQI
jgi:hypothetical protein